MSYVDLASEMAAARERRALKTATALRDSRVVAVRAAVRPGSSAQEIEEVARSFYPRLAPELVIEVTELVCQARGGRVVRSAPVAAEGDEIEAVLLDGDVDAAVDVDLLEVAVEAEAEPETL